MLLVLSASLAAWLLWRGSPVRESLVTPRPPPARDGAIDPASLRAGLTTVRQSLGSCESPIELRLVVEAGRARVVSAVGPCETAGAIGLEFPAARSRPGLVRVQLAGGATE